MPYILRLFLILLMISYHDFIAAQNTVIDDVADKLAVATLKEMVSNDVPSDIRILVLPFRTSNDRSDTIVAPLGMAFARAFEHELQKELKNKTRGKVIIQSDKVDYEMREYFLPGSVQQENEFYQNLLREKTPDYAISGTINIDMDYTMLTVNNVHLLYNRYCNRPDLTDLAIPSVQRNIKTDADRLKLLKYQTVSDIDQAAEFIARQIRFQCNIVYIQLSNLTYGRTYATSEFSERLSENLTSKLTRLGGYQVSRSATRGLGGKDRTPYLLSGNYIEEGDKLKINVQLINTQTNYSTTCVVCYLPMDYLSAFGMEYKPPNIEQDTEIQKIIDTRDESNDFEINLWTNKGNEGVTFFEGEILKITVISNMSCYLRLVDVLADGTMTLMLDNEYLEQSRANAEYTLPDKFTCSAPFGAEKLILMASTSPFAELDTFRQGGYTIIRNDLGTVMARSRGFVTDVQYAEKSITVTTMGKISY
ncbi:MAG: DUF4384 domain-containing protein [Bacteroidales bacterium]|nr:DUF4384 domain-containing protein [Bacteroidales bacterium]